MFDQRNRTISTPSHGLTRPYAPPTTVLTLWSAFLVALPHYPFPSGGLQPADGLLLLLVIVLAIRWSLGARLQLATANRRFLAGYTHFVFYVALVNVSWSLILGDARPSLFTAYYAYGLLVLSIFFLLDSTYGDRFLAVTYWSTLASMAPVILVSLGQLDAVRPAGTFNNPNQLGYFAVLAPMLMGALPLKRRKLQHDLAEIGAWIGSAFLVFSSASLGAAAAYGAGALIMLLFRLRNPKVLLVLPVVVVVVVNMGSPWFDLDSTAARFDRVQARSEADIGPAWLQDRGYDRVRRNPQYLVLGAGEGVDERFGPFLRQQGELHSSVGVLVFSYGAVGAALFAVPLVRLVRRGAARHVLMLTPALVYGISHQGLRFRIFWLLLAAVAVAASSSSSDQGRQGGASTGTSAPLREGLR